MKKKYGFGVGSFAFVLMGCAGALQTGSLNEVYESYKDTDYEKALEKVRLAENINEITPELQAELAYLKAKIYEQMDRPKEADTLYKYLKDQHSKSQYGYFAVKRLAEIEINSHKTTK